MKKFLLGTNFIIISIFAYAQHGLENIFVEKYYISTAKDTINSAIGGKLPIGSVTYRNPIFFEELHCDK